ncbi:hypothetical protein M0813_30305 [Anaeramoeba flamelloides]|uniref:Uncharacterized protein n=1 Tax=Anaeramoeba flamelloides TaxID=1746091 RepID=A0ABQ8XKM3_9EUKA|nr:hypothetical protein M0813_30305 [Anaeramoeba flamelloides]
MDQSQTKSLLSKTSQTEISRGLVGLNEEEIEIEFQTNTYAIDRNKTVVIIKPNSIHDLQIGTFLKPPPLTKNHNDTEGLFLEDLPKESKYFANVFLIHSLLKKYDEKFYQCYLKP